MLHLPSGRPDEDCQDPPYYNRAMPIGTAVHERTFALAESLNYREWSGYYAVSAYEAHHDHEYNAIRNASALIDVSPLFKYIVRGRDAAKLVDRVITRDAFKLAVGQVYYTPWCDDHGKVIDDGTVTRIADDAYRWTAADPSLRWFTQNAIGLDVTIEDISEQVAALALQGPTSGRLLEAVAEADIRTLKYFRMARGTIAGVPVEISRTGYTGDLGYEIWMPWDRAIAVWDALMRGGRPFDIHPAGMLALDVARVEAGLLLIDVDFNSSKKALIESQKYTPFEMGLGRLVQIDKRPFVGRVPLLDEYRHGSARQIVGLEISWPAVEKLYDDLGMPPQVASAASRVAVPVYRNGRQVGRATTTTWSPVLKKLIALATIASPHFAEGTALEFEITVEAARHRVPAIVVKTPFFNPPRKTAPLG
jgi:aminomethyltransferase